MFFFKQLRRLMLCIKNVNVIFKKKIKKFVNIIFMLVSAIYCNKNNKKIRES